MAMRIVVSACVVLVTWVGPAPAGRFGRFHVDPMQANGSANSIDGKCDLTLKKDAEGTVFFRWLPSWRYCDMSRSSQFSMSENFFPVGSRYQGMEVRPMPDCVSFLHQMFRTLHPTASDVNVMEYRPIPELGQVFRRISTISIRTRNGNSATGSGSSRRSASDEPGARGTPLQNAKITPA